MTFLDNFIVYIQNLNKKDFEKYLISFLLSILILLGSTIYYIYNKNYNLILEIKKLKELVIKTTNIIKDNVKIEQKEKQQQQLLEQNKDFSIKTYFEQFCKEKNVIPELNWGDTITREIEGSDKFDEVLLTATFKNQTTQIVLKILDSLEKNKLVYTKELTITNENNKKITFEITIATIKYKKTF